VPEFAKTAVRDSRPLQERVPRRIGHYPFDRIAAIRKAMAGVLFAWHTFRSSRSAPTCGGSALPFSNRRSTYIWRGENPGLPQGHVAGKVIQA